MLGKPYRSLSALASFVVVLLGLTIVVSSQTGQPSTANGEWPSYNADLRGTRYSPLDQINASNFNKLEIAWLFKTDNLRPFPEYKLEGTPLMIKGVLYTTGGTRRSVVALDAKTGEMMWAHSYREGKRAAVAPRQLSGRGVAYWSDGKGDDRVLYVTTGYRLIALNAKNGAMISSFGKDGVVDLKVGAVKGNNEQIDLETGEIGIHSTPIVVKDTVIIGSSMREGATVPTHNNTKGLVRAFDARTGKQQLFLWRLLPQLLKPVHHCLHFRFAGRTLRFVHHQETLAVGRNVPRDIAQWEQRVRRSCAKRGIGLNIHNHQLVLLRIVVKQLLAVAGPARLLPAFNRNRRLASRGAFWARERTRIHPVLAGLVGGVCNPSAIRRNLRVTFVE